MRKNEEEKLGRKMKDEEERMRSRRKQRRKQ